MTAIVTGFASAISVVAAFGAAEPSTPPPFVVIVSGAVRAQQAVPWTPGITVTKAINRAGGTGWRYPRRVFILRGAERIAVDTRAIEQDPSQNPKLQPGDTVEVPE